MNEFIDERDGNRYKVIKIGNLYWFAENLRYEGVEHHFPDRDSDNVPEYGCLYTWENAKLACPEGWRLPTKEDFEALLSITGTGDDTSSIRDESWKNSSNSSGFGALPAGYRWWGVGEYNNFGLSTIFWSATPHKSGRACYLFVSSDNAGVLGSSRRYAFSVRYVKDV